MTSRTDLSLAFINRHPVEAGRVLSSMSGIDAASFFDSIPTRYAVTVFQALSASVSASIVRQMDLSSATAVIRDLEFDAAAAILRQLDRSERDAYLADLPRRRKRDFETSLTFAQDSVGSRMTTDIATLSEHETVQDGLRLIVEASESRIDTVYVVDDKRQFLGIVHVLALLRHPATTRMENLADPSYPQVSPSARLAQVSKLEAWTVLGQLPVVSRRGQLIGAIYRSSVIQYDTNDVSISNTRPESIASLLTGAMLDCSRGLVGLFTQPPSAREVLGNSNEC